MKKLIIGGTGAAAFYGALVFSAIAADYKWTGVYVGLNAGAARGTFNVGTQVADRGTYFGTSSAADVDANGSGSISSVVFTGGIQAGYNWQTGNLVSGFEVEFDRFATQASRNVTVPFSSVSGVFTINQEAKTNWLFAARPRLGFANNNWLWYLTGGVAVTRLNYKETFTSTNSAASEASSVSKIKVGWTVGGGAEYALLNSWSVKAEYLYVAFGDVSSTGIGSASGPRTFVLSHSASLNSHIIRLGINKKF